MQSGYLATITRTYYTVSFLPSPFDLPQQVYREYTPKRPATFIEQYDQGKNVEPFEFEIALPTEALK